MIIRKIIVGPLETNCYLAADAETKEAIVLDPGGEPGKIIDAIKNDRLQPRLIVLTHSHFDHTGALEELKKHFQIDCPKFKEGDEIKIGREVLKVIETPGHTPDGICLVGEDLIFTGDTLFRQGIGRTDFPGGDISQMRKSLERLMEFPDNFKVYPGHGEETTIGQEK